jgi:hypothetical protein
MEPRTACAKLQETPETINNTRKTAAAVKRGEIIRPLPKRDWDLKVELELCSMAIQMPPVKRNGNVILN